MLGMGQPGLATNLASSFSHVLLFTLLKQLQALLGWSSLPRYREGVDRTKLKVESPPFSSPPPTQPHISLPCSRTGGWVCQPHLRLLKGHLTSQKQFARSISGPQQ